jgi:hypothetical protein
MFESFRNFLLLLLRYWGLNSRPTPWATPPDLFCDGFWTQGLPEHGQYGLAHVTMCQGELEDTPTREHPYTPKGVTNPLRRRTGYTQAAQAGWQYKSWPAGLAQQSTLLHTLRQQSRDYSCVPLFASLLATLAGNLPQSFSISRVAALVHGHRYLLALATLYRSVWSPFPTAVLWTQVLPEGFRQWALLAFTRTRFLLVTLPPRSPSSSWWGVRCVAIPSINVWTELVALHPLSRVSLAVWLNATTECTLSWACSLHLHLEPLQQPFSVKGVFQDGFKNYLPRLAPFWSLLPE